MEYAFDVRQVAAQPALFVGRVLAEQLLAQAAARTRTGVLDEGAGRRSGAGVRGCRRLVGRVGC